VVKILLPVGAKINIQPYGEWTPLMSASARGRLAMLKILLAHGAEVNLKTRRGETAFSVAKNKEVIQLLKGAGAR